tara:strand:- start:173 stop:370 length:198 start_codon:yes stop_codon:yes gene_type:complete
MDNERRANKALDALKGYIEPGEGIERAVRDLLADLMHLARAEEINIQYEMAWAEAYYKVEVGGLD